MSSSEFSSIKATNVFLYFQDLANAQVFYERTLGLRRILDYGFASIHQISATSYVGLVDETKGMHHATEPKTVTLSFITKEIDGWYQYLTGKDVTMHRPLKNATRHPTRGFVGLDPEGYFLEFETFLEREQNTKLNRQLEKSSASYPTELQKTLRPDTLGIQGNIIWLYYKNLTAAQQFYNQILGLTLFVDQGFAKVYFSSDTGFIGLVDEAQGLHRFSEEKSVTVSFFTDDVQGWYSHLRANNVQLRTPSISIESDGVEYFVAYDTGGYFLEFDRFLDIEKNRNMLNIL